MNESGKKAYEIAYALWRIAANLPERAFAEIFRNKAIEFVGFAADGNNAGLDAAGSSLQALIKFAVDVNAISIANAEILHREIGNMKAAIPSIAATNIAATNIADIFTPQELPELDYIPGFLDLNNDDLDKESGKKAEIRQAAILEKIRQIGNCRLADIQAILPGASERTIRYDLESLVRRNLIDRIGTGGRSVYYRAKDIK